MILNVYVNKILFIKLCWSLFFIFVYIIREVKSIVVKDIPAILKFNGKITQLIDDDLTIFLHYILECYVS